MKLKLFPTRALFCLGMAGLAWQSDGASYFSDAPKSYQQIAAMYETADTPALSDFRSESVFSSTRYEWNAPASSKEDILITVALEDQVSGVLKYPIAGSQGPVTPFLNETKENIRSGRLSYLKVSAAGTELENLFNNRGCMHLFSYRKKTNDVSGFDVMVSKLTIWGNCAVQIAIPYWYRYFILLQENEWVETTMASDLYDGTQIIGHLEKGTILSVESVNQNWVFVRKANEKGMRGWVRLGSLKKRNGQTRSH